MATADTAPQGPGLQDAATAFEGILDRESDTPVPEKPAAPPKATNIEAEGVEPEAEAPEVEETPPEADKAEEDTEGDEAADTAEDAEAEPPKATPLYTVKVAGKDEQVTLEEALRGYSRHRDYTQKTDALATDRHVLQEERQAVLQERQQYATLLQALSQQLQQEQQQEPDWDALYQSDPLLWAKTRDDWRDKQDRLAAAQFEMQRLAHVQGQEQAAAKQAELIAAQKRMREMEPAWKDVKRWEADRVKMIDYATTTAGYSREEISQATDPRAVVLLDKARRWDELQAKQPKPTTQRIGPQVARAGSAPVSQNSQLRARQRLAQSGRIEDAAKVFQGLLE